MRASKQGALLLEMIVALAIPPVGVAVVRWVALAHIPILVCVLVRQRAVLHRAVDVAARACWRRGWHFDLARATAGACACAACSGAAAGAGADHREQGVCQHWPADSLCGSRRTRYRQSDVSAPPSTKCWLRACAPRRPPNARKKIHQRCNWEGGEERLGRRFRAAGGTRQPCCNHWAEPCWCGLQPPSRGSTPHRSRCSKKR